MSLGHQAGERTPHAQHFIRGLRSEDDHSFLRRLCPLRTMGVVSVRFAAGPAGDRVLGFVEDANIEIIGGALFHEQVGHPVLGVMLVDELEQRTLQFEREPGHGTTHQGRGPVHRTNQPGRFDARELGGGGLVDQETYLGMRLQEARRQALAGNVLHRWSDHACLRFAPGQQHDLAGGHDGADAHRDGMAGHIGLAQEVASGVAAG